MPSNKGNDSDTEKAFEHNPASSQSNQRPDAQVDEYDLYRMIKESSPNKNTGTSSSTSQIIPELEKKEEKTEYAISCSCCSCIKVPVLQLNIPKVTVVAEEKSKSKQKQSKQKQSKQKQGSKKNGKENSNKFIGATGVTYNTPAKRKAPPKGPFPYAKRKFFKSGGLLERYEAQQSYGKFCHEDDTEDDDDCHSASSYDTSIHDDMDSSDSDEFTFPRRRDPCNDTGNERNCTISN